MVLCNISLIYIRLLSKHILILSMISTRKDVLCVVVGYFVILSLTNAAAPPSNAPSQWDFHQDDYDIKLERAEIISCNHSYFNFCRADFVPVTRTQRVLNATLQVIKDIVSHNARLDIQLYKFMSNEYRFFPISISVNPCDEYLRNTLRCREILAKVSNIRGCPLRKGIYYVTNGVPDFSRFPPLIPRGQYKMTTIWHNELNFLGEIHFYGSVNDKPSKWQ